GRRAGSGHRAKLPGFAAARLAGPAAARWRPRPKNKLGLDHASDLIHSGLRVVLHSRHGLENVNPASPVRPAAPSRSGARWHEPPAAPSPRRNSGPPPAPPKAGLARTTPQAR